MGIDVLEYGTHTHRGVENLVTRFGSNRRGAGPDLSLKRIGAMRVSCGDWDRAPACILPDESVEVAEQASPYLPYPRAYPLGTRDRTLEAILRALAFPKPLRIGFLAALSPCTRPRSGRPSQQACARSLEIGVIQAPIPLLDRPRHACFA